MSGLFAFCYAVVAYAAGFAALTWFIGFVMDVPGIKTVNSGDAGVYAVLVNLALVAAFGAIHSLMARPGFKRRWTRIVPAHAERSTYVLVSAVMLGVLMAGWQPMALVLWEVKPELLRALVYAIGALGWIILFAATFMIDHFELFGLRQAYARLRGGVAEPVPFRLTFLYAAVRHPIMLGLLIGLWAAPTMTAGHGLLAAAMTVYILIGVHYEERDLVAKHGERYERYRRDVPKLLPRAQLPRTGAPATEEV